ncbi:MAG: hypothetical protein H0U57_12570 [Tatlockia sp.]|nr:hypothetical protein [Tatlockia sp.]
MTIFLDIAKYFLIEALEIERKRAKDANTSYIGSYIRETEHSEKKRQLAKNLIDEISMQIDLENDQKTWLALKNLIANCHQNHSVLCKEAEKTEGEFRKAIIDVNSLLDGIYYHVFQTNNLLNIKCDLDPDVSTKLDINVSPSVKYYDAFDKFIYYCAFYWVNKYQHQDNQTYMENCWRGLSITSAVKVGTEKLNLLEYTLALLQNSLAISIEYKKQCRMARKDSVLIALNSILGGNASVCKNHILSAQVPLDKIGLSFFGIKIPLWEPASGQLKEVMEKALAEIKSMGEAEVNKVLEPNKLIKDSEKPIKIPSKSNRVKLAESKNIRRRNTFDSFSMGDRSTLFGTKENKKPVEEKEKNGVFFQTNG